MSPVLIEWSEQTAKWMEAASEHTGFHRRLAEKLLPLIPGRDSLLDLGCGIGLIDFALSPAIGRITCVDQNAEALRGLERIRLSRGIQNIETSLIDARDVKGQWDTVLSVFFGQIGDVAQRYLRLCSDALLSVVHGEAQGRLGPAAYHPKKCITVSGAKDTLDALGVSYTLFEDALEYGQPFVSLSDAAAFVRAYSKNPPGTAVEEYLQERLVESDDPRYPYYLPNLKRFGVFVIPKKANARFLRAREG